VRLALALGHLDLLNSPSITAVARASSRFDATSVPSICPETMTVPAETSPTT
jgi:hypothetical protein